MTWLTRRYTLRQVQLADGARITGHLPGSFNTGGNPEQPLRDELAELVGGVIEARLSWGRADVLTTSHVYEVEQYRHWRDGVRQVLAYSAQCRLEPMVGLFCLWGLPERPAILDTYLRLRDASPSIGLWWHDGVRWQWVTSRAQASRLESNGNSSHAV